MSRRNFGHGAPSHLAPRRYLCFLVQDFAHLCADAELDGRAKAGAGVNALGITDDATGKFGYDSRALQCVRDADIDPREPWAACRTHRIL